MDDTTSNGNSYGVEWVYKEEQKAYEAMIDMMIHQIKMFYDDDLDADADADADADETSPWFYDPEKEAKEYSKLEIEKIVEWCNWSITDSWVYLNFYDCEQIYNFDIIETELQ